MFMEILNNNTMEENQRELTFGEAFVGVNFNPSKNPKVDRVKEICAELIDLVRDNYEEPATSEIKSILYGHVLGQILNAQMCTVKILTLSK